MEFFWFVVIQFSFITLVAFSVHYAGRDRERKELPVNLDIRREAVIYGRNLRTHEQVVFPFVEKNEITVTWIVALFSGAIALGCLAGFLLYQLWDFLRHSWF